MNMSRRSWTIATAAGVVSAMNFASAPIVFAQGSAPKEDARSKASAREDSQPAAAPAPGELTDDSLGKLLEAIGLKPKRTETRYDFTFASKQQDQEWTLSMSTVLSQDKRSIWVMAWLDELPRSARDVPRTALLGLLAENDRMGKGKFFSYIPSNRRFVLQQVVENHNMTSGKFRGILVDLGQTVSQTYGTWTVANWKDAPIPTADDEAENAAVGPPPSSGSPSSIKTGTPATPVNSSKTRGK